MPRGIYIRTKECNEAHKGKHWKLSEERKREMSLAQKGKPHPHKGWVCSEETKRK